MFIKEHCQRITLTMGPRPTCQIICKPMGLSRLYNRGLLSKGYN